MRDKDIKFTIRTPDGDLFRGVVDSTQNSGKLSLLKGNESFWTFRDFQMSNASCTVIKLVMEAFQIESTRICGIPNVLDKETNVVNLADWR